MLHLYADTYYNLDLAEYEFDIADMGNPAVLDETGYLFEEGVGFNL